MKLVDVDIHTFKSDQLIDLFESCIKQFEQSPVCQLPIYVGNAVPVRLGSVVANSIQQQLSC